MTRQRGSTVLIGDLLVACELIDQAQLSKAMPVSQKTGLPIGRVLVESGIVSNTAVRAAILAQSLIRDNLLHTDLAVKALRIVKDRDGTLEEALSLLGWRSQYYERTNKLGDLLVESGCLTERQLKDAFEVCFASGLPLGRVLVLRQVLPEFVAYAALTAQVLMREQRITRQQAVEVVREANTRMTVEPGAMRLEGARIEGSSGKIRLGELLIAASIVTEIDLVTAVERAIVEERPIGQVLLEAGLITEELLGFALDLQGKVNSRVITPNGAVRLLREEPSGVFSQLEQTQPITQEQIQQASPGKARRTVEQMSLEELLKSAGLSQEKDLTKLARELLIQKEHLAFKIVSQQEEIKTNLARELHDTIIADLMMLKRYLSGDKKLSPAETIEIVDHVVKQLRDICWDFAPRQLQDLGLAASLGDLLERVQQRTSMQCQLIAEKELPPLPEPVKLHIFRLMQECLNNVEKYSGATRIVLTIEQGDSIRFILTDDGRGFQKQALGERTDSGGMGMGSMRERAELIRVYFPTHLSIESEPGRGTCIVLELIFRRDKPI
jgi:signal transduction histidine kinase